MHGSLQVRPDTKNWAVKLVSHPAFGITTGIVSVVGLILTIYFAHESVRNRDLVFYVNPVQAVVVKTGEASRLRVFYGNQELRSDVTAAQVAFWNAGNESIRPENILQPVVIRTRPAVPILEATVRKKSRSVVAFGIDESDAANGVLKISWNILEGQDGAVIQVVYAGPPSTELAVYGIVEGQRTIRRLRDREGLFWRLDLATRKGKVRSSVVGWGYIALGPLMFLMTVLLRRPFRREYFDVPWPLLLVRLANLCVPVLVTLMGIAVLMFFSRPAPPFGF